jgi:hypothetical protein
MAETAVLNRLQNSNSPEVSGAVAKARHVGSARQILAQSALSLENVCSNPWVGAPEVEPPQTEPAGGAGLAVAVG